MVYFQDAKAYHCLRCIHIIYLNDNKEPIADDVDKVDSAGNPLVQTLDGTTSRGGQATSNRKPIVRSWGRRRSLTNQSNTIKADDEIEAWLSKQPSTYLIDYKETLPS